LQRKNEPILKTSVLPTSIQETPVPVLAIPETPNTGIHLLVNDGFSIYSWQGDTFKYPPHEHDEMELTLVLNASGMKRIVGDHVDNIGDVELVLIGPNLRHGWLDQNSQGSVVREVTIWFPRDLLPTNLLEKNQLVCMRQLFEDAKRGVLFSRAIAEQAIVQMSDLEHKSGFESLHGLFMLLNQLSMAHDRKMLSDITFTNETYTYKSRRLDRAFKYMNSNFERQITLPEVAKIANMPPHSFSRFIKTHTGRTYIDNLVEIRIGHVSRMLIGTNRPIAEIAYACGFNNLANFNRIFKAQKGLTPMEFKRIAQDKTSSEDE
jgi:AraC-like DNA-binding protein